MYTIWNKKHEVHFHAAEDRIKSESSIETTENHAYNTNLPFVIKRQLFVCVGVYQFLVVKRT